MRQSICIIVLILMVGVCFAQTPTPTPTPQATQTPGGGIHGMYESKTISSAPIKLFTATIRKGPYWIYNLSQTTDVWIGFTPGGHDFRLVSNNGAWDGILPNGRVYIGEVWAETSNGVAEIYHIGIMAHPGDGKIR